jgi:hypothetical protein
LRTCSGRKLPAEAGKPSPEGQRSLTPISQLSWACNDKLLVRLLPPPSHPSSLITTLPFVGAMKTVPTVSILPAYMSACLRSIRMSPLQKLGASKLRLGHAPTGSVQLQQASSRVLLCPLTHYDSMTTGGPRHMHRSYRPFWDVIVCKPPCFGTSFPRCGSRYATPHHFFPSPNSLLSLLLELLLQDR